MLVFRKIGILLVSLIVALGIAEILTRIYAPHPRYQDFMIADERVGSIQKPGARGRAANMFGEYDTALEINHEGFRDRDHALAKPLQSVRIAFLGDSFTFAEQVEEKDCFVRRTEALLDEVLRKKTGGRRIIVPKTSSTKSAPSKSGPSKADCMNFGIGGWDTYQEVLCYETFVQKYHPDIVVLAMYVHNDIIGNVFYLTQNDFARPYFRLTKGQLEKVPADPVKLRENQEDRAKRFQSVHWYQNSQFYNFTRVFSWNFRQQRKYQELGVKIKAMKPDTKESFWNDEVCQNYRYYAFDEKNPVVIEANEVTHLLLKRLDDAVRKNKGRLCLILLPAEENIWPDRWKKRVKPILGMDSIPMDFERPFRKIPEFLPELSKRGDILDLRPALIEADKTGPIFFPKDSHYNLRGQEAVAQAVSKWLESRVEK